MMPIPHPSCGYPSFARVLIILVMLYVWYYSGCISDNIRWCTDTKRWCTFAYNWMHANLNTTLFYDLVLLILWFGFAYWMLILDKFSFILIMNIGRKCHTRTTTVSRGSVAGAMTIEVCATGSFGWTKIGASALSSRRPSMLKRYATTTSVFS